MKKIIAVILVLMLLSLIGCVKETPETEPETGEEATTPSLTEIENGISEIDDIEQDINLDDLDGLEEELDEIDW